MFGKNENHQRLASQVKLISLPITASEMRARVGSSLLGWPDTGSHFVLLMAFGVLYCGHAEKLVLTQLFHWWYNALVLKSLLPFYGSSLIPMFFHRPVSFYIFVSKNTYPFHEGTCSFYYIINIFEKEE